MVVPGYGCVRGSIDEREIFVVVKKERKGDLYLSK
jgi:hypothetical protein